MTDTLTCPVCGTDGMEWDDQIIRDRTTDRTTVRIYRSHRACGFVDCHDIAPESRLTALCDEAARSLPSFVSPPDELLELVESLPRNDVPRTEHHITTDQ